MSPDEIAGTVNSSLGVSRYVGVAHTFQQEGVNSRSLPDEDFHKSHTVICPDSWRDT